MKKFVSIVMFVLMLASTVSVLFASAAEDACDCGRPPLVYVVGQSVVYDDPKSENRQEAIHYTQEEILAAAKKILPKFAKGAVTQQWGEYCDAIYESVLPFVNDYALSAEGTVKNSSGIEYTWSEDEIYDGHDTDSVYTYEFRYDPRLDPWEIADDLNRYIETVKKVTGHSTVCLLSRCMGTGVAMSYLIKYASKNNFADIDTFILYNATINGFDLCGELYSGNLKIDADSVDRYANDKLGTDYLNELFKASVSLLNENYTLDIAAKVITDGYMNIRENLMPRIFRASYGTCPGYWGMVNDKYYEQAKSFIFEDKTDEYSTLIGKLDNYHYNVQLRAADTVLALKEAGVKVGIVCKYGLQSVPLHESSDIQSDNTVDLYSQSFGATCSKIDETLSSEYLEQAEKRGASKYISPDKQVDASTCLLPDNTWFIKDLEHITFPNGANPVLIAICRAETQATVESNPEFPQYIAYDKETDSIAPLTDSTVRYSDNTFVKALINFLKAFFNFIRSKIMNPAQ